MNHWSFCNAYTAEPAAIELESGTVCYFSAPSPDKRTPNEDSLAIVEIDSSSCVICVADGAGGYHNGDVASRLAITAVIDSITTSARAPLHERLTRGFENAQTAVRNDARGGGTTLIVALCSTTGITTYLVGDSCLCIAGGRGKAKAATVAQSPTGYAVKNGDLHPDEALHHKHRHLVSGLLGLESITVDVWRTEALAPRDTVVLASDGLYDNLYLSEITALAAKRPQLAACQSLVEACHDRMRVIRPKVPSKPDDLSVVLFRPRNRYQA